MNLFTLLSRLFNKKRLDNSVVMFFFQDNSFRYGWWLWNTFPGKFKAILRFDHQNDYGNKDFIVNETLNNINRIKLGEIIRTNQYGNQSHCLTPQVIKVYN